MFGKVGVSGSIHIHIYIYTYKHRYISTYHICNMLWSSMGSGLKDTNMSRTNPCRRDRLLLRVTCPEPLKTFLAYMGVSQNEGVTIIRFILNWGPYWGPFVLGNYV